MANYFCGHLAQVPGATSLPSRFAHLRQRESSKFNAVSIQMQMDHFQVHTVQPFPRTSFVLKANALCSTHECGHYIGGLLNAFCQRPPIALCFRSQSLCWQFNGTCTLHPVGFVPLTGVNWWGACCLSFPPRNIKCRKIQPVLGRHGSKVQNLRPSCTPIGRPLAVHSLHGKPIDLGRV